MGYGEWSVGSVYSCELEVLQCSKMEHKSQDESAPQVSRKVNVAAGDDVDVFVSLARKVPGGLQLRVIETGGCYFKGG